MENKGFLLVLMQPPPTLEDEFNAWYDTEHVPERLAVPGFETALRYVCISGAPRYLAVYDMTHPDVLASEAYLRVSFERSSPWTKRVTSRVKVYRSAGRQVYPGNAITSAAPRALLLRFRNVPRSAESTIVAGVRANFESRPETVQARVFAYQTGNDAGSAMDYLCLIEARAPFSSPIDSKPFGDYRAALDMMNEYAPWMP
jgi:hypothetical protein